MRSPHYAHYRGPIYVAECDRHATVYRAESLQLRSIDVMLQLAYSVVAMRLVTSVGGIGFLPRNLPWPTGPPPSGSSAIRQVRQHSVGDAAPNQYDAFRHCSSRNGVRKHATY